MEPMGSISQSSFHFSEHFFLFSKLHPSMLQHQYLTLLSFKEMKFSKASSIPSQRYSLFHILKCKLRCMVRFSSLLLLPLALCQPPPIFPKPPECRKWCRGAARAGSHTMALFSSQMRSHHVTSLLPPSRGIGDTEMGLGSDSAWDGGRGGKQEGALRSYFAYLPASGSDGFPTNTDHQILLPPSSECVTSSDYTSHQEFVDTTRCWDGRHIIF